MIEKGPNIIESSRIFYRFKKIKKYDFSNVHFSTRIYGGMSNKSYIYELNDEKFIVHISTKGSNLFVRRKYEADALLHLQGADFIQPPLYVNIKDEKYRIFKYIEGVPLNTIPYHDYLKEIAHTMKELHSLPNQFGFDYKPYQYLDFLLNRVNLELDPSFYKGLDLVKHYKEEMCSRPVCPCHNDCQPSNMILGKDKKVYLIDFEFAANNDYIYDIASFGNLDFKESIFLLNIYNSNYTIEDLKVLFIWRIFIDLQWYLIAMKKYELGYNERFNLDFKEVALFFLNQSMPLIEAVESNQIMEYKEKIEVSIFDKK